MDPKDKQQPIAPPPLAASAPKDVAPSAPSASVVVEPPAISASDSFDVANDVSSQLEREHAEAQGLAYEPEAVASADPGPEVDPVTGQVPWVDDLDVVAADAAPVGDATAPVADVQTKASADAPATDDAAAPASPPAAAAPLSFDPLETIHIAEGYSGTREQVAHALQNGAAALNEAQAFQRIFGQSAADAERAWLPLLTDLRSDAQFADYLQRAIDHYKTESTAQKAAAQAAAPQPQYAPIDPQTRNEIAELRAWKQQQEAERQQAVFRDHVEQAKAQYPILAADKDVLAMVAQRVIYRAQNGQPGYTLLDGVRELAPWLAEQQALRAPKPAPAPQPEPVVMPALNSGAGAAPAATRSTSINKPKSFKTTDDAVAEFLESFPSSAASGL